MTDLQLLIKKCVERPAYYLWLERQLRRREHVLCRIERPGNPRRTMQVTQEHIKAVQAAFLLRGEEVTP